MFFSEFSTYIEKTKVKEYKMIKEFYDVRIKQGI